MEPMVYKKNYIFNHFYSQYLVLLTIVPRNTICERIKTQLTSNMRQSRLLATLFMMENGKEGKRGCIRVQLSEKKVSLLRGASKLP